MPSRNTLAVVELLFAQINVFSRIEGMPLKIVVIDNYDSFTYNLVHYLEEITGGTPSVFRNDAFELEELDRFDVMVLSPGPGLPQDANQLMAVIARYASSKIILGVCLGHQALALHFGAQLKNLNQVYHGVASRISIIAEDELHQNHSTLEVGRYHSWVADAVGFPEELLITSKDKEGNIMSFRHTSLPVFGIQYHPESVLTPNGKEILKNFVTFCRTSVKSFSISKK